MVFVKCEFCGNEVGKKHLSRHQLTKYCRQVQNKPPLTTPCSKCNKFLTFEGHRKHVCQSLVVPIKTNNKNLNDLLKIPGPLKTNIINNSNTIAQSTNTTIDQSTHNIDNSIHQNILY